MMFRAERVFFAVVMAVAGTVLAYRLNLDLRQASGWTTAGLGIVFCVCVAFLVTTLMAIVIAGFAGELPPRHLELRGEPVSPLQKVVYTSLLLLLAGVAVGLLAMIHQDLDTLALVGVFALCCLCLFFFCVVLEELAFARPASVQAAMDPDGDYTVEGGGYEYGEGAGEGYDFEAGDYVTATPVLKDRDGSAQPVIKPRRYLIRSRPDTHN
jgi:uncharacterized membrane protein YidH (DUF202 family)